MDVVKLQQTFGIILIPLSYIYRLFMGIRRLFCDLNSQKQFTFPCPCISIGNISWGGTGKTPVVDWFLDWSDHNNLRTTVLTRGYKSKQETYPLYVKAHHTAREAGDEPLMLALQHPDASILVDPKRIRAGKYAIQSLKPELVLLDDGFQHISLPRSLDLVLFQEQDLTIGWNKVIPAGSWREGAQALNKASAFIIKANKEKMEHLLPIIKKRLFQFKKPVFSFQLQPLYLQKSDSMQRALPKDFHEKPYILITGVADPKNVLRTIEAYVGTPPQQHFVYPDHHRYTFHEIKAFTSFNVPIICTMKDFVKLQSSLIPELWGLQVKAVFEGALWSQWSFPKWISMWWSKEQQVVVESFRQLTVNSDLWFNAAAPLFFYEGNTEVSINTKDSDIEDVDQANIANKNKVEDGSVVSDDIEELGSSVLEESGEHEHLQDQSLDTRTLNTDVESALKENSTNKDVDVDSGTQK